MKLLVTGGSGFIALHLIRHFLQAGWDVDVLVRESSALDSLKNLKVNILYADLTGNLEQVRGQWDAVINTAGLLGKFGNTRERLRAVNVDGADRLFRSCRHVPHFIHLSTVGAMGPVPEQDGSPSFQPRDEESPCHPSTDYEQSKYDGEKTLIQSYMPGSCRLSIIRVGFVYGPEDYHKLSLFRAVSKGYFFFVGPGSSLFQPIFVEDLVRGIEHVVHDKSEGIQIFNLCGKSPVSWQEFVGMLATAMGRPAPKIKIPVSLCRLAASILEGFGKTLAIRPPLTHAMIHLMTRSYTYSMEKAEKRLGFSPNVGLEEGVARTVNWYRERRLI